MGIELAIALVLGFVVIYVLLIRIFSTLLRLTGLAKSKSKFQAISLITNTGFTTSEAEIIATSRARRKIATAAMISGHVFSVIIVSLVFNFISVFNLQEFKNNLTGIIIVFAFFVFILIFFKLPFMEKWFEKILEKVAIKLIGKQKQENVITLLDNYGRECIAEIVINSLPKMMEEKPLGELNLRDLYKINILSIRRKNRNVIVDRNTFIQKEDVIVVFGLQQGIFDLFKTNANDILENQKPIVENFNNLELVDNFGKEAMVRIKIFKIPNLLQEKTLNNSGLKENYGINLITLVRNKNSVNVDKNTILKENDLIVVVGPYSNIKKVFCELDNN